MISVSSLSKRWKIKLSEMWSPQSNIPARLLLVKEMKTRKTHQTINWKENKPGGWIWTGKTPIRCSSKDGVESRLASLPTRDLVWPRQSKRLFQGRNSNFSLFSSGVHPWKPDGRKFRKFSNGSLLINYTVDLNRFRCSFLHRFLLVNRRIKMNQIEEFLLG